MLFIAGKQFAADIPHCLSQENSSPLIFRAVYRRKTVRRRYSALFIAGKVLADGQIQEMIAGEVLADGQTQDMYAGEVLADGLTREKVAGEVLADEDKMRFAAISKSFWSVCQDGQPIFLDFAHSSGLYDLMLHLFRNFARQNSNS